MIDEIVKKIILGTILKVVMGRIIAALPFLAIPIIGPILTPIVSFFVGKVINMVAEELILMINLKLIDVRVGGEVTEYDKSVEELKIELAKPIPNEAAVNEAKEKLKKKLHDLVNFNPTK